METVNLTGNQFLWISLSAIAAVTIILCTIAVAFRGNKRFFEMLSSNQFMLLHVLAVLFILWAITVLGITGMVSGDLVAGIIGTVVGYVFGSGISKSRAKGDGNSK